MLTDEQRVVLAHIVVDPDAWYAHAIAHFGQAIADEHLAAKVEWHKAAYLEAKGNANYETRAEREEKNDAVGGVVR